MSEATSNPPENLISRVPLTRCRRFSRRLQGVATIIVERDLPANTTRDELVASEHSAEPSYRRHGVQRLESYLSDDGSRVISVFEAADVETVREARRDAELACERIWAATVHARP